MSKQIKKKICRFCGNLFYRNPKYSETQWKETKFCSRQCAVDKSRKHKDAKAKHQAYRRRQGMFEQGSEEMRKRVSEKTKLAMQRPEVQEKIRQPRTAMTLEQRMVKSDKMVGKMPKNMMDNSTKYPNIKRGYYDINGTTIYFRSKWEANYALYLDFLIDHKEIIKWEYEPDTFMFEQIKLGTRSYTPDFKIFNNDGSTDYHEVKGYMDSKSKTKLKRMAKYYSDVKLILIEQKTYTKIVKQLGGVLKFY